MRSSLAVAVAAAAALVLALSSGAAAAGASGRLGALLEARASENPTRGEVVMCQRQFDGESKYTATPLDIFHWRNSGRTDAEKRANQAEYVSCFSGGRQAHRQTLLMLDPHQTRSLDWGVEVDVEKNWTSNFIQVTNSRDEPVRVQIDGEARNVTLVPPAPQWFRLPPKSTKNVMTVTRYQGVDKASFVFGWRAEPVFFRQSPQTVQLSSKGVTLSVRHTERQSVFTVYNERTDPEPVKLAIDIKAMIGTKRSNIVARDANKKWVRDTVMVTVDPGAHQQVLTVRPRRLKEAWYYTWNYKWEAGDSPLAVFGLGEI